MSLANKFNIPPALFETIKKMNEGNAEYQAKVKALMAKRGIKSLADLSPEEKKDFFNTLDSMHKAKNENVTKEEIELDEVEKKLFPGTPEYKAKFGTDREKHELKYGKSDAKKVTPYGYRDKDDKKVKEDVELDEAIPKSTNYALVHSSSKKIIAKGNKTEMMKKMKELNAKEKNSHHLGMTNRGKVGDTFGEEVELEEGKSGTGYELYHKDFSSAMQHAYDFAKKKYNIEIDPTEIDRNVAMGPKKPSSGKANAYRLLDKTGKKAIQVQVANLDNKRYELNMYKEEVEQVDELKKSTLASYADKASDSVKNLEKTSKDVKAVGGFDTFAGQIDKKIDKRRAAMANATKKMSMKKEEVEELDELSKDTLKSYTDKASSGKDVHNNPKKNWLNRISGLGRASEKLKKEEIDLEEGYEKTVLDFLDKRGFNSADFRDGNLYVSKSELAGVKKALQRATGFNAKDLKVIAEEQIDELKRSTLASYIDKAAADAVDLSSRGKEKAAQAKFNFQRSLSVPTSTKAGKQRHKEYDELIRSQEMGAQKLLAKSGKRLVNVGIAARKLAATPKKLDSRIQDVIKKIENHIEFERRVMGHESIDIPDFMKAISFLKKGNVDLAVRHAMSLDSDPRDFLLSVMEPIGSLVGKRMREEVELTESHFKPGQRVMCIKSGMKGTVIKVNKPEVGKYYDVTLDSGKRMKYAPDELKLIGKMPMKEEEGASKKKETEFHKKLDTLVHKTFGKRPEEMKEEIDFDELSEGMSAAQIKKLRDAYAGIDKIDVSGQPYKNLVAFLDKQNLETLKMLAGAKIKFISGMAQNRVVRKMNEDVEQIDELSEARVDKHELSGKIVIDGHVFNDAGKSGRSTYGRYTVKDPDYKPDPKEVGMHRNYRKPSSLSFSTLSDVKKWVKTQPKKSAADIEAIHMKYADREKMYTEESQIDEISADVAKRVAQKRDLHFRKNTPTETQKRRMGRGDWRADPQLHADKARQSAEKRGAKDVYDYHKKEEVEFDEASNPQISMKRAGLSVERAKEVMRHQKEIGSIRKKREALRNSYDPAIIEAYKKMKGKKKNEVTKDDNQVIKSSDKLSGKQEPIELDPELKEQKT